MLVVLRFAAAGTSRRSHRLPRSRRCIMAQQQADDVGGVSVRSRSIVLVVSQFAAAGTSRRRPHRPALAAESGQSSRPMMLVVSQFAAGR